MSVLLVLLLILFVVVALLWYYIPILRLKWRLIELEKQGHKVPLLLLPKIPFIGESIEFLKDQENFIIEKHRKHGKAVGFFLQNVVHFSIDMKTYMKEFYAFPYEQFSMDVMENIFPLSDSFIFLKVLRSAHPGNLLLDIENIRDQFQKFLDDEFKFSHEEEEQTRDLNDFFYKACAVFNVWTFVGLDYSLMQPFIKELIPLYEASNRQSDLLYAYPMLSALFRHRLAKFGPAFEKLLLPIIKERRKEQNSQRHDILQVFLDYQDSETGQTLSDREILSEVFSLLQAAGSVATSMADIVNRMVVDEGRPYLQKIEDEQRSVIKELGPEFNANSLAKMTYYDAAIRETLRLEFTLTSWRRANIDIRFHDGLVIPKGELALMTMVGVNLNEELFPDVQKWSPDRYVTDDSQKAPSPFIWGAGLHPCAGRKHAQLGMKLPPLMMLRQFHLRTSEHASRLHIKKRPVF